MKKWFPLLSFAMLMTCSAVQAFGQGTPGMMGEHDMSGTVRKINHDKGTFELKTDEGTLRLHFPPSSVKDVKNGDMLTVHLAFQKGGSPMSMPMPMK